MDTPEKIGGKSYGYYTKRPTIKTDRSIPRALFRRETGFYRKQCIVPKEFQWAAEDKLVLKDYEGMQCQLPGVSTRSTFLMVFSTDGKRVASTHGNHHIYVSDLTTGKNINTLIGHPRTPWCIAFHPSSNQILASGCLGGQVRVWDLHGGSEIWVTSSQTVIASIAFHPIERLLVIATYNELYFWDWSQEQPYAKCYTGNEKEKVRYVTFDPLGSKLITGISNAPIVISQWDRQSVPQPRPPGNVTLTSTSGPDQTRINVCYRSLVEQYENLVQRYFQLTRARAAPTMDRGTDPMEMDSVSQSPSTSASRTRGLTGAFMRTHLARRGLPRAAYYRNSAPSTQGSSSGADEDQRDPSTDVIVTHPYETEANQSAFRMTSSRSSNLRATMTNRHSPSTSSANEHSPSTSNTDDHSLSASMTDEYSPSTSTSPNSSTNDLLVSEAETLTDSAASLLQAVTSYQDSPLSPVPTHRMPVETTGSRRFFVSQRSAFEPRAPRAEVEPPRLSVLDIVPNDSYWDRTVRGPPEPAPPSPPPPPPYPRPDPSTDVGVIYGVQLLSRHIDNMQRLCRARLEILQLQQIRRMWEDLQTQIQSLHIAVNVPRTNNQSASSSTSEPSPSLAELAALSAPIEEARQARSVQVQQARSAIIHQARSAVNINPRGRRRTHAVANIPVENLASIPWFPPVTTSSSTTPPRASTSCRLARYLHFRSQMSLRRSRLEAFRQPRGQNTARRHFAGRRHDVRRRPVNTSESLRSMISRLEELVRQQRVQRELARRGRHSTLWRNSAGELTDPLERPAGRTAAEDRLTTALANEEVESNRLYHQATASGAEETRQEAWQRTRETTRVRARQVLTLMVESLTQFFEENGISSSTPRGVLDDQIYNLFILLQLALELTDLLLAQLASTRLELEHQWVNRLHRPVAMDSAASSTSGLESFRPVRQRMDTTRDPSRAFSHSMSGPTTSSSPGTAMSSEPAGLSVPVVRLNDVLVVDTAALNQPRSSPRSPPHPRFLNSGEPQELHVFRAVPAFPAENMAMPDIPVMPNHRIQAWDFSSMHIPDISCVEKNVVAGECKIHNDASVDVSQDGHLLVTLLPSGRLSMTTMLGIYSLQWGTLGQCLYTTSFEQNAVSVSLSPVSRHLLVGLALRRVGPVPPEGHIMAQIFRLDPSVGPTGQGPARGRLWHLRDLEQGPDQPFISLNCIRWAPGAGQGLVYGTNNGQLRVVR